MRMCRRHNGGIKNGKDKNTICMQRMRICQRKVVGAVPVLRELEHDDGGNGDTRTAGSSTSGLCARAYSDFR